MSVISRMRRQRAVWWRRIGNNSDGSPNLDTPVEIRCRWDDEAAQIIDPITGTTKAAQSIVYVDRVVTPGDFLVLKLESELSGTDAVANGAREIMQVDKNPNFRNSETLITAYL